MSRQPEEQRIAEAFCMDIQKELRENGDKPHWKNYNLHELFNFVEDEMAELNSEITDIIVPNDYDRIISESADIGAYCAMINDNARRLKAEMEKQ